MPKVLILLDSSDDPKSKRLRRIIQDALTNYNFTNTDTEEELKQSDCVLVTISPEQLTDLHKTFMTKMVVVALATGNDYVGIDKKNVFTVGEDFNFESTTFPDLHRVMGAITGFCKCSKVNDKCDKKEKK